MKRFMTMIAVITVLILSSLSCSAFEEENRRSYMVYEEFDRGDSEARRQEDAALPKEVEEPIKGTDQVTPSPTNRPPLISPDDIDREVSLNPADNSDFDANGQIKLQKIYGLWRSNGIREISNNCTSQDPIKEATIMIVGRGQTTIDIALCADPECNRREGDVNTYNVVNNSYGDTFRKVEDLRAEHNANCTLITEMKVTSTFIDATNMKSHTEISFRAEGVDCARVKRRSAEVRDNDGCARIWETTMAKKG